MMDRKEFIEYLAGLVGGFLKVASDAAEQMNVQPSTELYNEIIKDPEGAAEVLADLVKAAFDNAALTSEIEKGNLKIANEYVEFLNEENNVVMKTLAIYATTLNKIAEDEEAAYGDSPTVSLVVDKTVQNLGNLFDAEDIEDAEQHIEVEEMKEDIAHAILEGANFAYGIVETLKDSYKENQEAVIAALQIAIAINKVNANAAALAHDMITFAFIVGQIGEMQEELSKFGEDALPVHGDKVFAELLQTLENLFGVEDITELPGAVGFGE